MPVTPADTQAPPAPAPASAPKPPNVSQNTKPILLNPQSGGSTEPMRHPARFAFDTTTPMVKPGAVSRFGPADVQKYGPWLIPKLTQRWPQVSAMTFSGWVMGWTNVNTILFVKTEHAVGMAEVFKETPDLKLKAREVFVFCNGVEHEDEAVLVYKEFKRWARSMGVDKIRNIGGASDLSNVRLRNNVAAVTDNGLKLEL